MGRSSWIGMQRGPEDIRLSILPLYLQSYRRICFGADPGSTKGYPKDLILEQTKAPGTTGSGGSVFLVETVGGSNLA